MNPHGTMARWGCQSLFLLRVTMGTSTKSRLLERRPVGGFSLTPHPPPYPPPANSSFSFCWRSCSRGYGSVLPAFTEIGPSGKGLITVRFFLVAAVGHRLLLLPPLRVALLLMMVSAKQDDDDDDSGAVLGRHEEAAHLLAEALAR